MTANWHARAPAPGSLEPEIVAIQRNLKEVFAVC
jgi:hypothetical protein